jgi:hypothetical protein
MSSLIGLISTLIPQSNPGHSFAISVAIGSPKQQYKRRSGGVSAHGKFYECEQV